MAISFADIISFGYYSTWQAEAAAITQSLGLVYPLQSNTPLPDKVKYGDPLPASNNAITHAYVSAKLTQNFGADFAKEWGDWRENDQPPKAGDDWDAFKDMWNNEVGRRIGSSAGFFGNDNIVSQIKEAMRNGSLIVVRTDGRIDSKFVFSDDAVEDFDISKVVIIQHCFIAGTMIDMWPLDVDIRPGANGLYDKADVLANVWQKPIEQITPDDWVVSFDKAGHLKPGKVTRTFNNESKIILDLFGTGVTPGHVYYRPDSKKPYKFEPLIDILRDDGVIQKGDGTLIRAATNCEVDSEDDREFWAFTVDEDRHGNECVRDKKKLRLGTRFMLPNGNHFSMQEYMQGIGLELLPDGYVKHKEAGLISPFVWTLSDTLPNPEDFVLACSGTTLEDIYKAAEWEGLRPEMPPPMVRDSGPVQPLSQAGLTLMPRNTPLAMREGGSNGMFNRKQRKAAEAKERQQAKGKKWLLH